MTLTSSYPVSAITHLNCNFIHRLKHLSYLSSRITVIAKYNNLSENALKAIGYHIHVCNCVVTKSMHSTNTPGVQNSVPD